MIPIFVLGSGKLNSEKFLASNFNETQFKFEEKNFADQLGSLLKDTNIEIAILVSANFVLPKGFNLSVKNLAEKLADVYPSWGAAGNFGVLPFAVGMSHSKILRYRTDSGGLATAAGYLLPASSITTDLVLVNLKKLREVGIRELTPHAPKEVDVALAVTLAEKNLGLLVAPELAAFSTLAREIDVERNFALSSKLSKKISSISNYKVLKTTLGRHEVGFRHNGDVLSKKLNLDENAIHQVYNDENSTVSIVVRTQFRNLKLLDRTLTSAQAFIARARPGQFSIHVVADRNMPEGFELPSNIELLTSVLSAELDTRFLLVEIVSKKLSSDFVWFVDDDDWIFPNEASKLSRVIDRVPRKSLVFVGSQHFHERGLRVNSDRNPGKYSISPGHYFTTVKFKVGLTGLNQIPFCSVIWPMDVIRSVKSEAYAKITYAEDFFLLLHGLSTVSQTVFYDHLLVGISIRNNDNTVNLADRTKWNMSNANIAAVLSAEPEYGKLLSSYTRQQASETTARRPHLLRRFIALLFDQNAWRAAKDLNIFKRILRLEISPQELLKKIASLLR